MLIRTLLCITLLVPTLATAKRPMTLEDISRIQRIATAVVAPDGKQIAYIKSIPRKPYEDEDGRAWAELHVSDTNGNSRSFISGEVNIGNLAWSPDSKKIYYLAKRGDDEHKSLYAIPVDGGESAKLSKHKADIKSFSLNHDGSKAIFIAKPEKDKDKKKLKDKGFKAKVYEEDIDNAQLYLLDLADKDKAAEPFAIEGSIISASFNPRDDRILAAVAPSSLIDDEYMQTRLGIYSSSGRLQEKIHNLGKLGKARWSKDGTQIAYVGVTDINDPSDGQLKVTSATNPEIKHLQAGKESHVQDFAWSDNGQLLVLNHVGTQSELVSVNSATDQASLPQPTDGLIVRQLSHAANGTAVIADSATHPSELYWLENGASRRLTNSNPWLDEIELGRQTTLNYQAKDGLNLQGVLVYPVDYKAGKRYPLIIFVHGGPESHRSDGWNTRYADPIQVAAGEGYFSFIPNYRGSTGRGVAFSKLDQHGYATPEFDDIVDGKNHLVAEGLVENDKVGITGGSYGGFATAWSATALSEHYAAGVMFVGISNQLSKFGTTDIPNEMYLVHARAWPWDDYQWMLERSPIYHVEKARTPLLIMHGENDTRVHPSQSMELYRYLKTLGNTPVRLVLYPGEGHGNRKAAAQLDYSMRLMRWMDHYLKGPGGKPPAYELNHQEKLEMVKNKDDEKTK